MKDLTIAPGPGIPDGVIIAAADLTERFSRSSGPGGQGVNTTDSKVQLSLDIATCASLSDAHRRRILHNLHRRTAGPAVPQHVPARLRPAGLPHGARAA